MSHITYAPIPSDDGIQVGVGGDFQRPQRVELIPNEGGCRRGSSPSKIGKRRRSGQLKMSKKEHSYTPNHRKNSNTNETGGWGEGAKMKNYAHRTPRETVCGNIHYDQAQEICQGNAGAPWRMAVDRLSYQWTVEMDTIIVVAVLEDFRLF
jgi:hypothetical protein